MIRSISGSIVADLGLPERDGRAASPGQPRRRAAQIGQGRAGDLDQLAVEQRKPRRAGLCAYRRLEASRRATGLASSPLVPSERRSPAAGEAGGKSSVSALASSGTERRAAAISTCRRRCC